MSLPTVSVIVPTFQRASILERTLDALCALDYPAHLLELVVVDDGSTDPTPDVVRRFARVSYLRQPNCGVAAARNRGVCETAGELLLFVDDDIVVAPDNIMRHLAVRDGYAESVIGGCATFDPDVRASLAGSPFGHFRLWAEDSFQRGNSTSPGSDEVTEALTVASGNMSIGRALFQQLGGFDERFPVGAEDQDLCWRARRAGAVIVRDCRINVIHNDQHADLRALSAREERGAVGLVYLVRKHPNFPAPSSLEMNGPVCRTDSPRLVVRKLFRSVMSKWFPLAALYRVIWMVELARPRGGWPLDDLYRAFTGLHVFRGIRKGIRLTSSERWPPAHEALGRHGWG